jgi:large conductance mechanosensitive channel
MADKEKKDKKGFIAEFKEFISRGNVIDMAVGIIIGTAFTAIVTSLVGDIISPAIGYLIGGIDFSKFSITLPAIAGLDLDPVEIKYGSFIQTIVNFLITALAIFCLIKFIGKLSRKKEEEKAEEPAPAPEPSAEEKLLTEIRDLLKEQKK